MEQGGRQGRLLREMRRGRRVSKLLGLWPAVWLLSQHTCWPQGVEIDIMEFKGHETKAVYLYSFRYIFIFFDECKIWKFSLWVLLWL